MTLAPLHLPEPASQRRVTSADLLLLAAITLWAANYSVVRFGVTEFHPVTFAFLRFGTAGLVFLVILQLRERSIGVRRADLPLLTLSGILGITVSQIAYVYSLSFASASSNALVGATAPLVTGIIATLVGIDRSGRWHWIAVGIGFLGVILIVLGGPAGTSLRFSALGNGLAFGSVICSCAGAVSIVPLLRRYSVIRVLTYELLIGSALMVPIAIPSLVLQDYARITGEGWAALAYNVVLTGIVANGLYVSAMRRVGPSRAAVFQYVQSFLGALFGVVLLSESVTLVQLLGGGIAVGSVVLSRARPREPAGRSIRSGLRRGRSIRD